MSNRVRVAIEEASGNLPALVDQALGGEEVVITRDDRAAVRLVPIPASDGTSRPIVGAAKGTVLYMADDFDAPLGDFNEYT